LPSRAASPFRPERKKTAAKRRGVNFPAFWFPAKGLSACYPNLADGQGCSICCNQNQEKKNMSKTLLLRRDQSRSQRLAKSAARDLGLADRQARRARLAPMTRRRSIMSAKSVETVVESSAEVFIPLNKLKKSPKNARKTPHSEAAIEAYAASIAAKGILQNLVIEPELDGDGSATGFYFVTIGEGRRLAQLLRVNRKEIKKTEPIRCIVDTANDPHEISLDENVTRENMHPAD
jgi:ParB-like nuclease domain